MRTAAVRNPCPSLQQAAAEFWTSRGVDGPLVFEDEGMVIDAALSGFGLAYLIEDLVAPLLKVVRLNKCSKTGVRPSLVSSSTTRAAGKYRLRSQRSSMRSAFRPSPERDADRSSRRSGHSCEVSCAMRRMPSVQCCIRTRCHFYPMRRLVPPARVCAIIAINRLTTGLMEASWRI